MNRIAWILAPLLLHTVACTRAPEPQSDAQAPPAAESEPASDATAAAVATSPQTPGRTSTPAEPPAEMELAAAQLLAQRLPPEQARQGWIRLFDGQTLFGWEIASDANWRVEEGAIVVDSGEAGLLCTSTEWHDYELTLEFLADPDTNSGVFLRTPLRPSDPASDCLEVNIAPDDNPFPTASVVSRVRAQDLPPQEFDRWRRLTMRIEGDRLTVTLDGEPACEVVDEGGLVGGRIGLQLNSGKVAFRDVRLRPIGHDSLLDEELSAWKRYPEMDGSFAVTDEGGLHVRGGKTQLESLRQYDDFTLLAEYEMIHPETNSGIFFRSIPGDEMMGYECQVNDEMIDGDPLRPADAGTGGIFRRQDARIVAAFVDRPNTVLLATRGPHFAAWVNGIQVSDVTDDREPDENPRRGKRLEAGTLMIQGHDAETDIVYHRLRIAPFPGVTSQANSDDDAPANPDDSPVKPDDAPVKPDDAPDGSP